MITTKTVNYEPSEFGDFETSSSITYSSCNKCQDLKSQLQATKDRLQECEEVVRFYGDNNSYISKYGGHIENKNFHSAIGRDCGKRARAYLAKHKEQE